MDALLRVEILGLLIPIAAIFVGGGIAVCKLILRHQERMALIERGIHPDHLPEDEGEHRSG